MSCSVGNFTFKQYVDVVAFQRLSVNLSMITLYDDGQSTTRKSSCLVIYRGYEPIMTVNVTIPLGYTRSLLKLTRKDSNGHNLLGSTFSCWSREVNNVSRAAIVNENSSGVESLYHKHDDQGIIMWLVHASSIFFRE